MALGIPLVRASTLATVTRVLEQVGAPIERLLGRAKLSPRILQDPEAAIPFATAAYFVEVAARTQGIDDLGIRAARQSDVQAFGTFGRLISQSFTVYDGLQTAYRWFGQFNSSVRAGLSRHGDQVRLHHAYVDGTANTWGHFAASNVIQYLNFIRLAAGPAWRPARVEVAMASLPGARDVDVLAETQLVVGQAQTTITLSAGVLQRPLPRLRNDGTTPVDWDALPPPDDFTGAVQRVVTTLLPDGYPDVNLVADMATLSARTLQRRLQDEGVTFGRVVERARFEMARRMLADPARKVIDVAFDVGYSDPAHFTRAFQRWTGVGPRAYRRQLAADAQGAASV